MLKLIDELEADPRLDVFNIIMARQRARMDWEKVRAKVKSKGIVNVFDSLNLNPI